jgi:hypothetical protein
MTEPTRWQILAHIYIAGALVIADSVLSFVSCLAMAAFALFASRRK